MMIAGGGTGGHLFPGIAVAEAARRRDPAAAVLFVGSPRGIEARVVPTTGFDLELLPGAPLRGRNVAGKVAALGALGAATLRARTLVRRFAPDAVVGLGGYASAPAVLAARLAHVPIVLLEQNARPGLTTRLLARLADRVCVSFPDTHTGLPADRAVFTGNPVRRFSASAAGPARRSAGLTIAIVGGSAGAQRLNQAGPALRAALADVPGLTLIHQTGFAEEATVRTSYAGAPGVEVRAFITDMGAVYGAADLIVCRAGATTIAELAAQGLPAIFVPYPHAADDHQRANAEALVRAGAARMVLDHQATGKRLAAEVRELIAAPGALPEMRARMRQFARPDAADRVLDVVASLAGSTAPGARHNE
ncbi:MAG: undecaprenyldiphospho-muramoylpentapeptide beta-N-acetylglucosaminyltransferase [Polyangiaceae bacterium UTPRO1]|jgi:UDP-N-acetylglucosamine--N-acetylmuramyl-(pentapeptide) pyrophosphoryl-undecaprenol N-acetylglucosamine transferase|nr:MAG: undecaprenyldiphospho-muramoylpentapeptide beta-N-acetylglucosaminyltransferase [Polyangiaceae bacterium UTPRO1]